MKAPEGLLEIELRDPEDFLKIRETLTRMGTHVVEDGVDTLIQTCHILHKRGRYYITHYRELMRLDGDDVTITEDDIRQRNAITAMLGRWGLCDLMTSIDVPSDGIKIVTYKQKPKWNLKAMYIVGKKTHKR